MLLTGGLVEPPNVNKQRGAERHVDGKKDRLKQRSAKRVGKTYQNQYNADINRQQVPPSDHPKQLNLASQIVNLDTDKVAKTG
jgi:hypothetical protein